MNPKDIIGEWTGELPEITEKLIDSMCVEISQYLKDAVGFRLAEQEAEEKLRLLETSNDSEKEI